MKNRMINCVVVGVFLVDVLSNHATADECPSCPTGKICITNYTWEYGCDPSVNPLPDCKCDDGNGECTPAPIHLRSMQSVPYVKDYNVYTGACSPCGWCVSVDPEQRVCAIQTQCLKEYGNDCDDENPCRWVDDPTKFSTVNARWFTGITCCPAVQ